jgi:hypothetical protein
MANLFWWIGSPDREREPLNMQPKVDFINWRTTHGKRSI